MTAPRIFNAGPPIGVGGQPITLVEASTFCLSDPLGDIRPGGPQGLYYRDARVLSRWELRVDGHALEPLTVLASEAFKARFVLRLPPRAGLADSTVMIERRRLIGEGLTEIVSVHNLGNEDTALTISLHADADFADLFAVKEGRTHLGSADAVVVGEQLRLTDHGDNGRGLLLTATGEPQVVPGACTWHAVVPAHGEWRTTLLAQPVVGHHPVRMAITEDDNPARRMKAWRASATNLTASDAGLAHILRHTESDLGALRIEGSLRVEDSQGGPQAYVAAGAPWFMTLFGRDSLITSWMALLLDSDLAVGTLRQLAELQGSTVDPVTEEEPGRIMHEMRRGPAGERVLGGSVYYGTVDATPLFVMLLDECRRWGADAAVVEELLPAADRALGWIDHFGDRDGDGFVEYQRKTDRGLANQGWKDSFDAINDATGHLAETPIALCEVQGYVYAARLARAAIAESRGDIATAERLRGQAADLRKQFDEAFWIPESGWYALALDGHKRRVDALTSNVAHCLWTGIVPDDRAAQLIEWLADPAMSDGFGLRTLAKGMGAYNPMSYHNGSIWPHDTAIAIAGLLRYRHLPGATELAERLGEGLLDAALAFDGRLPELFCGFPREQFRTPIPYPTSCSPQAWASATPLLLVRSFLGLEPDVPGSEIALAPLLPERWGRLVLADLRLGPATITIEAEGSDGRVRGLPADWTLTERPGRQLMSVGPAGSV
ncbi:amylo-alpha-1,6-glucosidase [Nocardia sp. CDC159]|uniref:Amylo-alpha-1,6-glucosidase n=1 Tax=Nocardia pulmonis TaxID=2951408 RepID=A0A9X2J0K0_9NOCA|nr:MULTISPECIES: glycogen debranching N-terminal domain-containing protein [Nocardia]MCM6777115.1 amylo-alpha-1,6-glucosidase [Nocardia pulmonis]MCM6790000.1 amylo-alpha-1,6-glucosidase [Nocardia sp. CDC159]